MGSKSKWQCRCSRVALGRRLLHSPDLRVQEVAVTVERELAASANEDCSTDAVGARLRQAPRKSIQSGERGEVSSERRARRQRAAISKVSCRMHMLPSSKLHQVITSAIPVATVSHSPFWAT